MKTRRRFLKQFAALGAGLPALPALAVIPPQEAKGFFTLGQRSGRWWLLAPEGRPFFSVALNHIDSSPLRHAEAGDVWARKYGNSAERWLKQAVRRDLLDWGFNSVGWTQEVVVRGDRIHRHSPPFTFEEYQWLGLPYCHLLPFSEIHQWEDETRHPDFFSKDFADWCDYVARSHCARMADWSSSARRWTQSSTCLTRRRAKSSGSTNCRRRPMPRRRPIRSMVASTS